MKKVFLSIVLILNVCAVLAQPVSVSVWRGEGEVAGVSFSYDRKDVETVENPKTGTKFTKYEITGKLVNATGKDVIVVLAGSSSLTYKFAASTNKLSEEDRRFCAGANNTGNFHGQLCKVNILCAYTTVEDEAPKHILCPVGTIPEMSYFNIRVEPLQSKPVRPLEPTVTYNPNRSSNHEEKVKDDVIEAVDKSVVSPTYPGGMRAFGAFLGENIIYPHADRESNIQGKANISFVVDTDGLLVDLKIISAPTTTIGAEALRVMRLSPKWIPGTKNGVPVRVRYTLPINFALSEK